MPFDPAAQAAEVAALPPERAVARLEALTAELIHHNHRYHVLADPVIDDPTYDRLYRELELLEQRLPEAAHADSPTRKVGGAPLDGLIAFPHRTPMLSLSNAFSPEELSEFDQRCRRLLGDDAPPATSM